MRKAKKAWIDVITPKQVLFFSPLAKALEEEGVRVLATARHFKETEEMARFCFPDLYFVGERGEGLEDQLKASTERELSLLEIVNGFQPDVAVSVASANCARISFSLGTRHVAINDSPHSSVANRLSLPLSERLLCPWIIPKWEWLRYGIDSSRVTRYRALDPAVWLKRSLKAVRSLEVDPRKKTVVIRPEERKVEEVSGDFTLRMLKRAEEEFSDLNVVVLPRHGSSSLAGRHRRLIIPETPIYAPVLLSHANLFIGVGGTMTTEACLMGVPSISAYPGELHSEKFLASKGLLTKSRDPEKISRLARKLLQDGVLEWHRKTAGRLLDSMEDPIPRFVKAILG